MPEYRAVYPFRYHHRPVAPGHTLTMTEDEARPHLDAGTLEPNVPDAEAVARALEADRAASAAREKAEAAARKRAAADADDKK